MHIRLMKQKDILAVSQLFIESYKREDKKMRWKEPFCTNYVTKIYRGQKDLSFVVLEGDKVIGCALSNISPEYDHNVIEFKVLLVHPSYRRKKIATKLMRKTCLKCINKYKLDDIEANIYTLTNFPITWYESIGFRTKKNFEIIRGSANKVLNII